MQGDLESARRHYNSARHLASNIGDLSLINANLAKLDIATRTVNVSHQVLSAVSAAAAAA